MMGLIAMAGLETSAQEPIVRSTMGGATLQQGLALQLELQSGLSETLGGGPDIGAIAADGRLFFALTPIVDLGVGARIAAIPTVGGGPVMELRVQALRREHFALAVDQQIYSAMLGGDGNAIHFNVSSETGVTLSTFVPSSHWEVIYGAMAITHILVNQTISEAAALRAGFAYRFGMSGQSLFYHMDIGTPMFSLWGDRPDGWTYRPLIRFALGATL